MASHKPIICLLLIAAALALAACNMPSLPGGDTPAPPAPANPAALETALANLPTPALAPTAGNVVNLPFVGSPSNLAGRSIDLFGLALEAPADWTLAEVNRRPEPAGQAVRGHDCADYGIGSPDGSVRMALRPTCGLFEGASEACPADAAAVQQRSDGSSLMRYYDASRQVYVYTRAGMAEISDANGTRQELRCAAPPIVDFGSGQNVVVASLEVQYSGGAGGLDAALQAADRVASSITRP